MYAANPLNVYANFSGSNTGPNFIALLTVIKEAAHTDAGNFEFMSSTFHGVAWNFVLCTVRTSNYRHSSLSTASTEIWQRKVSGEQ